ncbi:hypothetical protein B0H19DRAFT_1328025 [Mycena capillaripes]|nr:hypothetical protein B0H19DRAFT_1328025 [Mycena capillaripes]
MALARGPADESFLDNLSGRDLIEFRNYIHAPAYIRANAAVFLSNDWIIMSDLREFLRTRNSALGPAVTLPAVKQEAPDLRPIHLPVKLELISGGATVVDPVRTRTLREGDRDIVEILSDSDEDGADDSDFEVSQALIRGASRSSSVPAPADIDADYFQVALSASVRASIDMDANLFSDSDSEDAAPGLQESDTLWQDPNIKSHVFIGEFQVTTHVTVQRVEYIREFPSIWPILRTPTAFVISPGSEYDLVDPETDLVYTLDRLIKNHDNDSWKSTGTGTADNMPMVMFEPGADPIRCRRARMTCKCCCACERVDKKLIEIDRWDLDPASRDAVFTAQQDTRRREGTTAEDRTAGFFDIIMKKKCTASDSACNRCQGRPMLKLKVTVHCLGLFARTPVLDCMRRLEKDFKENHHTFTIPDYVKAKILLRLFDDLRIADDDSHDTPPCSRIVHPRTGLKQKYCHLSIRKALIIHKEDTPHRHPMPPLTKISLDVKDKYSACVTATGTVGATNMRAKRNMIYSMKAKKYPVGFGVPGALQLYLEDQKKPLAERYIHCCRMTDDGGILIRQGVLPAFERVRKNQRGGALTDYLQFTRAIHDFKGLVTPPQYERLMNFMYLDSKECLDEFSKFVKDFGHKKIQDDQDWWAHKEMSEWIIPCLVKSQSRILPED